uniref:Uncharacterized protein n=1 Tax=Avena sativa TaxID=4498 RepID=A0ACD5UES8_AVESA
MKAPQQIEKYLCYHGKDDSGALPRSQKHPDVSHVFPKAATNATKSQGARPFFAPLRINQILHSVIEAAIKHTESMKGSARSLVETAARQIKPGNGLARLMTITPQKQEKEISSTESVLTKDKDVEPIVAFSRPPPMPPVLGPLVALSLFQTSSSDEDSK